MRKGYTLLELLIVIGIIATILLIGANVYSQSQKKARDAKRKANLNEIRGALELFRTNNSYYPLTLNELTSGTLYIKSIPSDPLAPKQSYNYLPQPGCDNINTYCNNYTVGTILENIPTTLCATNISCPTSLCNFCLGPNGEK